MQTIASYPVWNLRTQLAIERTASSTSEFNETAGNDRAQLARFHLKCKLQDIPKIFWKCFTSISEYYFFVKNFKWEKTS